MSHVMVKTSIIKFIFVNIVCISCLLKFPNSFFVFSKWSAGTISNTARKTIFSFSTSPEKVVFPKKIALEYDLCRIIGKDHVSLSRKYDLNPRWKMKDDLFQKNTRKYVIFFKSGHDLSCIIRKDSIFSLGRKPAITFLKKYMEI